jgi:predicted tellurium resistance membrane protein TerC
MLVMRTFVLVMTAVAVALVGIRFGAFMVLQKDATWGVAAAFFCSIVSPILFHAYFREKEKKMRNKWILFVGMTVDILGFALAANAASGSRTADRLMLGSVVLQGLGWLYPHLVK